MDQPELSDTHRNAPPEPPEPKAASDVTAQSAQSLREERPKGNTLQVGGRWSSDASPLISLVVVVAIVLGIITVVRGTSATSTTSSVTNNATGASHATASPPTAPDFTLTALSGTSFHLASQRGHVVVLYFMSTTCTECVRGSYFVQSAMQEANTPSAQALAIDMNPGDTAKDVIAFEQSASIPRHAPLAWAFDLNQHVASRYGVLALGTVFVVDAQGHIGYESDGSVALGQLVQVVQKYA